MVKDDETVITFEPLSPYNESTLTSTSEFNDLVNMSASDLEKWLKEEDSTESGWSKDDGSGETVGHERYVLLITTLNDRIVLTNAVDVRSLRS